MTSDPAPCEIIAERPGRLWAWARTVISGAIGLAAWSVVVALAAFYAARFADADLPARVTQMLAVLPVVGSAVVAPLLIACIARRWYLLSASVVLALLWVMLYAPQFGLGPQPVPDDSSVVRIVTANTYAPNERFDEVIASLIATDADVIALQEVSNAQWEALAGSALATSHPYHVVDPRLEARGSAIMSRLELTDLEVVALGSFPATVGRVHTEHGDFDLLNVHPPSPRALIIPEWRDDLAEVAADVARRDRAVLVGDLNATYDHPELRNVLDAGDLRDAHLEAGTGWGGTWPDPERQGQHLGWSFPFLVRIDYVFVPDGIEPIDVRTARLPGSDHRMVVADVAVLSDRSS